MRPSATSQAYDELPVRVLRFQLAVPGFRPESVTLVTTLVDAKAYRAEELARLNARRRRIELWFRDLKTRMGMERLSCQSPKMVHKELEMFLIAYNLIRALMVEAGAIPEVPVERISFQGTVDAARQYSVAIAQARSKKKQRELVRELLQVVPGDQVPDRPGRREPRAGAPLRLPGSAAPVPWRASRRSSFIPLSRTRLRRPDSPRPSSRPTPWPGRTGPKPGR